MGRKRVGQRDVIKVGVVKGWEEGGWGRGMIRRRAGRGVGRRRVEQDVE